MLYSELMVCFPLLSIFSFYLMLLDQNADRSVRVLFMYSYKILLYKLNNF